MTAAHGRRHTHMPSHAIRKQVQRATRMHLSTTSASSTRALGTHITSHHMTRQHIHDTIAQFPRVWKLGANPSHPISHLIASHPHICVMGHTMRREVHKSLGHQQAHQLVLSHLISSPLIPIPHLLSLADSCRSRGADSLLHHPRVF